MVVPGLVLSEDRTVCSTAFLITLWQSGTNQQYTQALISGLGGQLSIPVPSRILLVSP